jgi:hypothetical protein
MFVPVPSRCHSGRDEGFHVVQSRANGGVEHFEGGAKFITRRIVPTFLITSMRLHLQGKARGSVLVGLVTYTLGGCELSELIG